MPSIRLALPLALGVVLSACASEGPPPPPVVLSMSPSAGPYGTEVTITGENFGDAADALGLELAGVRHVAITSWTDGEIRFRVPFPGTGAVTVLAPGGSAVAGTFTPDPIPWQVSERLGSLPIAAALLSNGDVGAVMTTGADDPDASVALASVSGDVRSHDLGTTVGTLAPIRTFEAGEGLLEAVFVAGSGAPLRHLRWDPGAEPALRSLEVAANAALGAAHDAGGTYVWIVSPGTDGGYGPLTRYRAPATPDGAWTSELSIPIPFALQKATRALRGAIADDGTLFVTWGKFISHPFDYMARPTFSRLVPSTQTWTHTTLGSDVDDAILASETVISPDGSRALVGYCWTDRDFNPSDPTSPYVWSGCNHQLYQGASALARAPVEDPHLNVLADEGLLTVDGTLDEGFVLHGLDRDLPFSLWPATPKWLLYDEAQGPVLIVEAEGAYVIRPIP